MCKYLFIKNKIEQNRVLYICAPFGELFKGENYKGGH